MQGHVLVSTVHLERFIDGVVTGIIPPPPTHTPDACTAAGAQTYIVVFHSSFAYCNAHTYIHILTNLICTVLSLHPPHRYTPHTVDTCTDALTHVCTYVASLISRSICTLHSTYIRTYIFSTWKAAWPGNDTTQFKSTLGKHTGNVSNTVTARQKHTASLLHTHLHTYIRTLYTQFTIQ